MSILLLNKVYELNLKKVTYSKEDFSIFMKDENIGVISKYDYEDLKDNHPIKKYAKKVLKKNNNSLYDEYYVYGCKTIVMDDDSKIDFFSDEEEIFLKIFENEVFINFNNLRNLSLKGFLNLNFLKEYNDDCFFVISD
jgi:hypothetical protein